MGMGNSVLDTIEGLAYVLSLCSMMMSDSPEDVKKALEELLSIGGGIVSIAKDPKGASVKQ